MAGWTCHDKETNEWDGTIKARKDLHSEGGTIQHTPTEEKDTVNKEYVDSIATRQAVELFLTTNASDIATYDDLDIDVSPDAETTIQQTIAAGSTTLINAFASKLGEEEINALEILESGIYDLHAHAEADFPNGMTIYFEFYHRTAGGTETLLGTSHDSDTLGLAETEIELHASITSDKNFISGDRIVVKVYGRNTGGANKDITIHMEGDTVSRTEFPGFISPTFVPAHVTQHETGGSDPISHDSIDDVSADDHHPQTHTIVSHDTTATGAELNTLTDNSMADALHRHSELSASDGTPDRALTVDAAGKVSMSNDLMVDTDLLFVDIAPGRVGINQPNPATVLDVVGDITVSGLVDGIDIATDVAANTTHRGSAGGTDHADVAANTANTEATSAALVATTTNAESTSAALITTTTNAESTSAALVTTTTNAESTSAALITTTTNAESTSAALVTTTTNAEATSAAFQTHSADSSDPHGANLSQTNLLIASAAITGDNAASAAAYVPNIVYNTTSGGITASNYPIGTLLVVYTA